MKAGTVPQGREVMQKETKPQPLPLSAFLLAKPSTKAKAVSLQELREKARS
jgi:hypothetical protein